MPLLQCAGADGSAVRVELVFAGLLAAIMLLFGFSSRGAAEVRLLLCLLLMFGQ
jgi:hypothetical protein